MEEKTKYLDLSASCDVSVTEMLQRFLSPAQAEEPEGKEAEDDGNN